METVIRLILVAAALIGAVIVLRPRPAFVIRVRDGKVSLARGRLSKKFLEDCQNLISECGIPHATIRGFSKADRVSLRFSRHVPASCHQRFRNIWGFHR
jgi:hypothetical protein